MAITFLIWYKREKIMTSADKFGIAFAVGFTYVMIGLISAGTFSTSDPSLSQSTTVETYSPPPKPIIEDKIEL